MTIEGFTSFYYTALVIIVLAIIILSLYMIIRGKNTYSKTILILLGGIGIVGLLFLLIIGSVNYFANNSSCAGCHEMNPEIATFKKSKHSQIRCLACHLAADNTLSFLIEEPEALKEVYSHITGSYPAIINANSSLSQKKMTSKVCLRCHRDQRPTFIFNKDMRINHNAHNKVNISCPTCHNRVTHKGARGYFYLDGLRMMDGCMRCHTPGQPKSFKGETAPTKCSTCHLEENIAKEAFGTDKVTVSDFSKCESCHKLTDKKLIADFKQSDMFKKGKLTCQSCHNDHLSENFIADPDPKKCEECHEDISTKVVDKKHGEKNKTPFRKVSQVRCDFCHPPHKFPISK